MEKFYGWRPVSFRRAIFEAESQSMNRRYTSGLAIPRLGAVSCLHAFVGRLSPRSALDSRDLQRSMVGGKVKDRLHDIKGLLIPMELAIHRSLIMLGSFIDPLTSVPAQGPCPKLENLLFSTISIHLSRGSAAKVTIVRLVFGPSHSTLSYCPPNFSAAISFQGPPLR